jgi:uncharacterized Zn finger protein
MRITLQAFSTSGGSYPVEVSDESGVFRMFCHCQAGMTQQMCKHKVALLKGDARMLYDPAQKPLLDQMLSSPEYPTIKQRLTQYELQLTEIEREIAKVKEKEKAIKHDFAYELTHGKPNTGKTYHVQPTANL